MSRRISQALSSDTNFTGRVVARFEYEPFGLLSMSSGSATSCAHRFTGKPQDSGTGLYYFGARYHDMQAGRSTCADPLPAPTNRYWFVRNDPMRLVDPDGCREAKYSTIGEEIYGEPLYEETTTKEGQGYTCSETKRRSQLNEVAYKLNRGTEASAWIVFAVAGGSVPVCFENLGPPGTIPSIAIAAIEGIGIIRRGGVPDFEAGDVIILMHQQRSDWYDSDANPDNGLQNLRFIWRRESLEMWHIQSPENGRRIKDHRFMIFY